MKEIQKESLSRIKQMQWLQLEKQLRYLERHSPYYQKVFKNNRIDILKISSYGDFKHLPITTKEDLQQYNKDFISVPQEDIIDYVTTSGTLGEPVSLALNDEDLQRLATNEYESFKLAGVKKEDVVLITTTLDRRFMAGLAYFLGLRKLGAGIVRSGSGLPQLQWDSIERFKPKYIICVPSFLLKILEYATENKIEYKKTSIKAVICIGEPVRTSAYELNSLGQRIKELWDIEIFSTYASTEMATAFTECEVHKGNHCQPMLIYPEILDENGMHTAPGEVGELVVTTLQSQTMPILRFATGDMLSYTEEPCDCGRNTMRLSPVVGRKKQMIKLKGTSIYPQSILEVLNQFPDIENFVIEATRDNLGLDQITVKVPAGLSLENIDVLQNQFKSKLAVSLNIQIVTKEEIEMLQFPDGSRKPQVFRDFR